MKPNAPNEGTVVTPSRDSRKLERLVVLLLRRTGEDVLKWEPAVTENVFLTNLKSGSVEISRFEWVDEDGHLRVRFELAVIDVNGHVKDRLNSNPTLSCSNAWGCNQGELAELFGLARSKALRAGNLVDILLSELVD